MAAGRRVTGGEVGERREGGEGIADAQEEVAVAEAPEVLGVVVQVPRGAGEDPAGGELKQKGVDDAILIVRRFIVQARDEPVNDEGEEKMFVINVVQREHRAAIEQEFRGEGLEAEVFQWNAQGWFGTLGKRGE